jgi:hypothetical protein
MSAIHKRLYSSLKVEFNLLARVFKLYLPPEYPYDVVGGQRFIKQNDFDDRVDILPVADPNIFSQTQRISLAQSELQLATSNPGIHNLYQVYRNMYEALGVKNVDQILKQEAPPAPKDPALEQIDAMAGKPFQAFPGQDHRAHITSHLNYMATNMARNAPLIMAALQKNILERISLMAQEQVEIEFKNEIQQLAMMSQNQQAMEGEERLNLDKMRAMMNQENQDEKLEQNEDLAKLRANTSIEKTILSKTLPSGKDMMGNVAIIRGKNETN